MDNSSLFGDRLKSERKRLKLNQSEAALRVGISREMWGKYERGVAKPSAATWMQLSEMGINVPFLLGDGVRDQGQENLMREIAAFLYVQVKIEPTDLAKALGVEDAVFEKMLNGLIDPPLSVLTKLVVKFGLDAQWLLTGHHYKSENSITDEFILVPVFDWDDYDNDGNIKPDAKPITRVAYRKDLLQLRGLKPQDLHATISRSDSMEKTISKKDVLLIDTSQKLQHDEGIFIIKYGNTVSVKRIQTQLDGKILLISDNPAYSPMLVNLQEDKFTVIGRVTDVSKEL